MSAPAAVPRAGEASAAPLGVTTLRKLRGAGVRPASELSTDLAERLLPVRPDLAEILPLGGLRKGSTVAVLGSSSLTLALLAEATARGSWAAVVGRPDLGVLAAHELGVELARLALVPDPGLELVPALDALFDGFDIIALSFGCTKVRPDARPGLARKLSARARQRGAVLIVDESVPGADPVVRCTGRAWFGARHGHGALEYQRLRIEQEGRGHGGGAELCLPPQGDRLPESVAEVG
ncbi:hypothetical protein [Sciscionella sediminilitoris]|uniref:hypothetical protein n=1 Tax=Sciscionella sediminilitoris TaxID=1445613 RepID=UPI000ACFEC70|nr:hypothetical protein [Sciscionella sp. SE31]